MFNVQKFTRELIAESGWRMPEAQKFAEWWSKVDAALEKKIGLGTRDIGDWGYADAYEDGWSPARAAAEIARLFRSGEL